MSAEAHPDDDDSGGVAVADERSTRALVADLADRTAGILRKEVQLLRAELGEKANQVVKAVGLAVAGLVLALVAANALVAALIAAIAELGLAGGWAALIVGVAIAIIGYGFAKGGIGRLKTTKLTPERTTRSLRQDATVARDTLR